MDTIVLVKDDTDYRAGQARYWREQAAWCRGQAGTLDLEGMHRMAAEYRANADRYDRWAEGWGWEQRA